MYLVRVVKGLFCGGLGMCALQAGTGDVAGAANATAVITRHGAFACRSWAAWHDFTEASLTPAGARYGKDCPIRLKAGLKVEIVEDDAGGGASVVRAAGKQWYVDNQALESLAAPKWIAARRRNCRC